MSSNWLNKNGWVYFAQCAGHIKIGFAADPQHRVSYLQVNCPFEVQFLGTMRGTPRKEKELHARWAALRLRPDREWFHATPSLVEFIKSNVEMSLTYSEERRLQIWREGTSEHRGRKPKNGRTIEQLIAAGY